MGLSSDLISQFVKITKDSTTKKSSSSSSSSGLYGTVTLIEGGQTEAEKKTIFVQLDGSELITPVTTTINVAVDDRVTVDITNHSATVTGNLTSPSVNTENLSQTETNLNNAIDAVSELAVKNLTATRAEIENLIATEATIKNLKATNATITDLIATNATIENLIASDATITDLIATNAEIENLISSKATITGLIASKAEITDLEATTAEIDSLGTKYANIDFANIGEAEIQAFYAKFGMLTEVNISEAYVTGKLIGVDITADCITSGTLKAERLILKGGDGLFHQINVAAGEITEGEVIENTDEGILGSIIVANSITAKQINVDDLRAFGATIGSFKIGDNSIYSGVKESIDNTTRGVYMDTDGQVYFGDEKNYIRYRTKTDDSGNIVYDSDGNVAYVLEISAEAIAFGEDLKGSATDLKAITERVKIGTYKDPATSDSKPSIELAEGDSNYKQVITNTDAMFMDGNNVKTRINTDGIDTNNLNVSGEFSQGQWIWAERANGNYGLTWKEES